jgi:hypothetical protein
MQGKVIPALKSKEQVYAVKMQLIPGADLRFETVEKNEFAMSTKKAINFRATACHEQTITAWYN